ncbi:MAG: 4-(cytidine 5'-diphospho)-2-C-methyl-D-erythritol kinase [Bryobacteraceae bacterium]
MEAQPRRARLTPLAKINLTLEVLHRRSDGFHELRTVFQTVSLADILEIELTPARRTSVNIECGVDIGGDIKDNLVVRAAHAVLDAMRVRARVNFRLIKRIPMGAGLGGGSSDAAAVLLALPVLAGRVLPMEHLGELAAALGSDVPFFLTGGAALGLGRGTEIYPLPGPPQAPALLVHSGIHVSTAEAYEALARPLTCPEPSHKINSSRLMALSLAGGVSVEGWARFCKNDFEPVVFQRQASLKSLKRRLQSLGAVPAMMTGSGSAMFGIFPSRAGRDQAGAAFQKESVFAVSLVGRSRYQALWWRQLREHIADKLWPPQSRYAE